MVYSEVPDMSSWEPPANDQQQSSSSQQQHPSTPVAHSPHSQQSRPQSLVGLWRETIINKLPSSFLCSFPLLFCSPEMAVFLPVGTVIIILALLLVIHPLLSTLPGRMKILSPHHTITSRTMTMPLTTIITITLYTLNPHTIDTPPILMDTHDTTLIHRLTNHCPRITGDKPPIYCIVKF